MPQAENLSMITDPYIKFNKTLKYFIRCMIEAFPESSEYKIMHTVYKLLKTLSKKQPLKIFMSISKDCQEEILAKNEKYFFDNTLAIPDSQLLKVYHTSAQRWLTFDDETKKAIWDHMAALVHRSRECVV